MFNNAGCIVAILAGGLGTRIQSVLSHLPKALAPINGKPFLFLQLEKLQLLGVKKVVLLTGYKHEEIVEACGDGSKWDLKIIYSREDSPLGTAGAVKNAEAILSNFENFILLNGDTFYDFSLYNFLEAPLDTAVLGLIGVVADSSKNLGEKHFAQAGSIDLDKNHFVTAFAEKPTVAHKFLNAGIYKFSKQLLNYIPDNVVCSLEEEIFPQLIDKNILLQGYIFSNNFYDIGTPEKYKTFTHFIKENE